MKLYLDELLTDVDVSQIQITEKHPLSIELIVEHTLAACQDAAPVRGKKRLPVALVAAIVVGLLATTALAVTTSVYHLKTVSLEYPVSEQGGDPAPGGSGSRDYLVTFGHFPHRAVLDRRCRAERKH